MLRPFINPVISGKLSQYFETGLFYNMENIDLIYKVIEKVK